MIESDDGNPRLRLLAMILIAVVVASGVGYWILTPRMAGAASEPIFASLRVSSPV